MPLDMQPLFSVRPGSSSDQEEESTGSFQRAVLRAVQSASASRGRGGKRQRYTDDAEKAAEPPISKTAFIYKPKITLGLLLVVLTSIHIILREYLGSKRIKITKVTASFFCRENWNGILMLLTRRCKHELEIQTVLICHSCRDAKQSLVPMHARISYGSRVTASMHDYTTLLK